MNDLSVLNNPDLWHLIQYPGDALALIGIHLPHVVTSLQCNAHQCVANLLTISF
jgi:hypothetical protein